MGCDGDVMGTECRPGRVLCVAAQPGPGVTVIPVVSVGGLRTGLVVRTAFVYCRGAVQFHSRSIASNALVSENFLANCVAFIDLSGILIIRQYLFCLIQFSASFSK